MDKQEGFPSDRNRGRRGGTKSEGSGCGCFRDGGERTICTRSRGSQSVPKPDTRGYLRRSIPRIRLAY